MINPLTFAISTMLILLPLLAKGQEIQPREVECLAKNVYFEARGEGIKGQQAVAMVTLNRLKAKGYPKTVCGVVYQKSQFSWTDLEITVTDTKSYGKILKMSKEALLRTPVHDITGGSTHFHASHIKPYWADSVEYVTQIKNHIFYREKPK